MVFKLINHVLIDYIYRTITVQGMLSYLPHVFNVPTKLICIATEINNGHNVDIDKWVGKINNGHLNIATNN